jgi:xanthosine utilization system XapX-like protein
VFSGNQKLQEAIGDLASSSFDRRHISVLGCSSEVLRRCGLSHKNLREIVDSPRTPRSINIAPEEIGVAEGVLVSLAMLIGVFVSLLLLRSVTAPKVAGTAMIGGMLGIAIGLYLINIIDNLRSRRLEEGMKRGGLVLWVSASNKKKEKMAAKILRKHGASNVHLI